MTVCDLWVPGQPYRVTGIGYSPEGQLVKDDGRPVAAPIIGDLHSLWARCSATTPS